MRVRRISVRIERSEIRIARKLSKLEPKVLLRNFPSVEQIQEDSPYQDSARKLPVASFAVEQAKSETKFLRAVCKLIIFTHKVTKNTFNIPTFSQFYTPFYIALFKKYIPHAWLLYTVLSSVTIFLKTLKKRQFFRRKILYIYVRQREK